MTKTHYISAGHLTQDKIDQIITEGYRLELGEEAKKSICDCRAYLDRKIAESEVPI